MKRFLLATALCCAASTLTLAQTPPPAIGIPPFSSIENGGFDLINRYNLNVHSSIPIVSAPGRGIDYGFALTHDSLIWRKKRQLLVADGGRKRKPHMGLAQGSLPREGFIRL